MQKNEMFYKLQAETRKTRNPRAEEKKLIMKCQAQNKSRAEANRKINRKTEVAQDLPRTTRNPRAEVDQDPLKKAPRVLSRPRKTRNPRAEANIYSQNHPNTIN